MLEKLAVICSHRMESLKEDEDYELQGNVKMQLKKLEDIDRSSIERKHEVEMQKLLRAAKVYILFSQRSSYLMTYSCVILLIVRMYRVEIRMILKWLE